MLFLRTRWILGFSFVVTWLASGHARREDSSPVLLGRKVAVCIPGSLEQLPLTADNLATNVVKAVGGAIGAQVDIFVYSSTTSFDGASCRNGTDSKYEKYLELVHPVEVIMESDVPLLKSSGFKFCDEWEPGGEAESQLQQMYSLFRVNQMRKSRELSYGFTYDWVVRLRADMLFVHPIPALEHLSPDRITLPSFHTQLACENCLNHNFAIGPADLMDLYMDMYHHMDRRRELCSWPESHLHHFLIEEQGWRRTGGIVALSELVQFVRVHTDTEQGSVWLLDADFQDASALDPLKSDTNIRLDLEALAALGSSLGQHIIRRMETLWDGESAPLQLQNVSLLSAVGLALGVPTASPLPGTLRLPDLSERLTAAHIARSVAAAAGGEAPFPHFFARGLFPDAVYAMLRQQVNTLLDWEDLSHKDANRADGSSSRSVISLNQMFVDEFTDQAKRRFWSSVLNILAGETVRRAVFAALRQDESQYIGAAEILLISDAHDYLIRPHADHAEKSTTVQIYLPADASRPHLGTTLYRTRAGSGSAQNQSREIEPFTHMQYIPNAAYGFRVGLTSFHGFAGGGMGNLESPRQSIILLYKRTVSQFSERSYQAADCADHPRVCPWGPEQKQCYHQITPRVQALEVGSGRHSVRWGPEPCPGGGVCCV